MHYGWINILLIGAALAAPMLPERDTAVHLLPASAISVYAPYTRFASAAYCNTTTTWSCAACKYLPGFKIYSTGGDGVAVPKWYVGWWPTESLVVVGHQGTDPRRLRSLINDADIIRSHLNSTMFPAIEIPSSVTVHDGFQKVHAASASPILAAVKQVLAENSGASVMVVGHSLGAAIATLDALYLRLNLLQNVIVKAVVYGLPRVGNKDFANLIDSKLSDFTHIGNKNDVIPILPGRFLGFAHPSGEKHVVATGQWYECPGHDNADVACSTGAVRNVFKGNVDDHFGPYEDIYIGRDYC